MTFRMKLISGSLVAVAAILVVAPARAATVSINPPTEPVTASTATLQLIVTVDKTTVTPPAQIQLTLILTNTGANTATNVSIDNLLPVEFAYVNGQPTDLKALGDLAPGDTITKSYAVTIPAAVKTNRYVDEAIASATNADSIESTVTLDVRNGKVLGAADSTVETLAVTGTSPLLVMLLGLTFVVLGSVKIRKEL